MVVGVNIHQSALGLDENLVPGILARQRRACKLGFGLTASIDI